MEYPISIGDKSILIHLNAILSKCHVCSSWSILNLNPSSETSLEHFQVSIAKFANELTIITVLVFPESIRNNNMTNWQIILIPIVVTDNPVKSFFAFLSFQNKTSFLKAKKSSTVCKTLTDSVKIR
eukprot:NODE_185_length_13590_cov_0.472908.p13 type:complete len:126 gc:universal NODE_185_length_13590_cov_0.472908:2373-1996(-)